MAPRTDAKATAVTRDEPPPIRVDETALNSAWLPTPTKPPSPPNAFVVWEAEAPLEHNFPEHNPFAPSSEDEKQKLSGGKWIGSDKSNVDRYLRYRIVVPKTGSYVFYARKFWKHGPFRFRFDDGPSFTCGDNPLLLDNVELRKHVVANWVALGDIELSEGEHHVRIDLLSQDTPVAFDQFLLREGVETPRGVISTVSNPVTPRPGYSVPDLSDASGAHSQISLRHLNEKVAGESGPIAVTEDGHLVHRNSGVRTRLWGVNMTHEVLSLPPSLMRSYATWLASLGVNLVRLHGGFYRSDSIRSISEEKLERLRLFHEAFANEGIYLALSIYFPLWTNLEKDPKYSRFGNRPPFGLYYYRDDFAEILNAQWERILAVKGLDGVTPLGQSPSLAYVEFANEDTTLFWSFSIKDLPQQEREELERQFGAYVSARYGSISAALTQWNAEAQSQDVPEHGRLHVMDHYQIIEKRDRRAQDTASFLAELMHARNVAQTRHLRNILHYSGLTVCSNFHAADPRYLDPLEKWSNHVCDVMDAHGYYEAPQIGEASDYTVRPGNRFSDRSALLLDSTSAEGAKTDFTAPPVFALKVHNKPQIVSEIGWTWPNRFRAELPALATAYGSLQALDGYTFFISEGPGFSHSLDKFTLNEPSSIGQFPAAALAFRRQLIRSAPSAATIAMPPSHLFGLKGLPILAPQNIDSLRDVGKNVWRAVRGQSEEELSPLSFWVGPVSLNFESEKSQIDTSVLRANLDLKNGTVKSNTSEIALSWKEGRLSVDAPSVSMLTGFFPKAEPLRTSNVEVTLQNDYASTFLVALDEKPLASSTRILLQIATESSQTGFVTEGREMRQIKALGGGPIVTRQVAGQVRLRRSDAAELRVTALTLGGQRAKIARSGADNIALLPDTMYYLIEPR